MRADTVLSIPVFGIKLPLKFFLEWYSCNERNPNESIQKGNAHAFLLGES